ncbi:hypothetical protein SAMN05216345_104307 [Cupriavidus sp. YR651]|uniref:hypothetical protein n=1 Tax=Cupriavidus sp. YR651 TaxID=1855315 RepID=UPI00088D2CF2|nr:hypothetical protein [Cupriavidus sp. YR651]SDC88487.1 hypothetical protein SAMN05216345_104307 [Cupriavidus sp. YR651]
MQRLTEYRGYAIHVDLVSTSKDMFDTWFQVERTDGSRGVVPFGKRMKVMGSPFSRRWAHLVGELAGRDAVDLMIEDD